MANPLFIHRDVLQDFLDHLQRLNLSGDLPLDENDKASLEFAIHTLNILGIYGRDIVTGLIEIQRKIDIEEPASNDYVTGLKSGDEHTVKTAVEQLSKIVSNDVPIGVNDTVYTCDWLVHDDKKYPPFTKATVANISVTPSGLVQISIRVWSHNFGSENIVIPNVPISVLRVIRKGNSKE